MMLGPGAGQRNRERKLKKKEEKPFFGKVGLVSASVRPDLMA